MNKILVNIKNVCNVTEINRCNRYGDINENDSFVKWFDSTITPNTREIIDFVTHYQPVVINVHQFKCSFMFTKNLAIFFIYSYNYSLSYFSYNGVLAYTLCSLSSINWWSSSFHGTWMSESSRAQFSSANITKKNN